MPRKENSCLVSSLRVPVETCRNPSGWLFLLYTSNLATLSWNWAFSLESSLSFEAKKKPSATTFPSVLDDGDVINWMRSTELHRGLQLGGRPRPFKDSNIAIFSFLTLFLVCSQITVRASFRKVQEVIVSIQNNDSFYLSWGKGVIIPI